MSLTKQQKEAYLADPTKCLCCGGGIIEGNHNDDRTGQHCECWDCKAEWDTEYIFNPRLTLTDITLTKAPSTPVPKTSRDDIKVNRLKPMGPEKMKEVMDRASESVDKMVQWNDPKAVPNKQESGE